MYCILKTPSDRFNSKYEIEGKGKGVGLSVEISFTWTFLGTLLEVKVKSTHSAVCQTESVGQLNSISTFRCIVFLFSRNLATV